MTYKTTTYILACILIIFCIIWWKNGIETPPSTVSDAELIDQALDLSNNYLKNASPISSGINHNTGEIIVLNNITGKKIPPCKGGSFIADQEKINPEKYRPETKNNKKQNSDCSVKAIDINETLLKAIQASDSPIEGTLIINGKPVKALFTTQVTASYKGSKCTTIQNDQNQYTLCLIETNFCNIMYNRAKKIAKRKNPGMSEEQIKQLILPDLHSAGCAEIINN